jgi:hypothetical protein
LENVVKGIAYVYTPPYSSHITPSTAQHVANASKMGLTIAMCLLKLRVRRQNLLDGPASPRANRAKDKATKRVASG